MQDNIVKAFRQRLIRAGFTDISIYDLHYCYPGYYDVDCISPNGEIIHRRLSLLKMSVIPRLVWFD